MASSKRNLTIVVIALAAIVFSIIVYSLQKPSEADQIAAPERPVLVPEPEKTIVPPVSETPAVESTPVGTPAPSSEPVVAAPVPEGQFDKAKFDQMIANIRTALGRRDRAEINRLVKELAKMGPDAIPAIENLLNNTDTNNLLRGELIKTLGSIGGHDAVRILLEEVRKTNSHIILFLATRTIKQAAKDVDLSEFLKEEMKNPGNFQVVSSLLSSMNKVEDPELLDNLKAMLANAQIPLEAKIQASKLLGDDGLHFLEETLKNTTDDFEITDILDAIEATGTVNAMNLLMILSQSEDYNDEIKALIGDSLTNLINNLADKDLSDSELEAVQEFLETRLKSGDESAFPSVVSGLANVNTDYARNLLRDEMTTRIKPNEVVAMSTALAQNYSNFDLEIPEDVSVNLFNIARKYMGTENPLEIRLGALNILNAIGGDEAQEILRGFENDGNPRIRDFVKRMLQ